MHISQKLSSAQGRKDQKPNRVLADEIVQQGGDAQLQELVDFFNTKPNKELQKDCVLTMAWVAEISPEMMVPHTGVLIDNFQSKINRVIWGSMIALADMVHLIPNELYQGLPGVLDAMESGTVVTRDHGFRILVKLYELPKYREDMCFIILEQLRMAPDNQLGQYVERLMPVLLPEHRDGVVEVLRERLPELSNSHHIKRLNKNLIKLSRF